MLTYIDQIYVMGFPDVLRPNMWLIFHIYLHIMHFGRFPMASRALVPIGPHAIFPVKVTLFPSGMLYRRPNYLTKIL